MKREDAILSERLTNVTKIPGDFCTMSANRSTIMNMCTMFGFVIRVSLTICCLIISEIIFFFLTLVFQRSKTHSCNIWLRFCLFQWLTISKVINSIYRKSCFFFTPLSPINHKQVTWFPEQVIVVKKIYHYMVVSLFYSFWNERKREKERQEDIPWERSWCYRDVTPNSPTSYSRKMCNIWKGELFLSVRS